jgi:hypothetical protein
MTCPAGFVAAIDLRLPLKYCASRPHTLVELNRKWPRDITLPEVATTYLANFM